MRRSRRSRPDHRDLGAANLVEHTRRAPRRLGALAVTAILTAPLATVLAAAPSASAAGANNITIESIVGAPVAGFNVQGDDWSYAPVIGAGGRYVAFAS